MEILKSFFDLCFMCIPSIEHWAHTHTHTHASAPAHMWNREARLRISLVFHRKTNNVPFEIYLHIFAWTTIIKINGIFNLGSTKCGKIYYTHWNRMHSRIWIYSSGHLHNGDKMHWDVQNASATCEHILFLVVYPRGRERRWSGEGGGAGRWEPNAYLLPIAHVIHEIRIWYGTVDKNRQPCAFSSRHSNWNETMWSTRNEQTDERTSEGSEQMNERTNNNNNNNVVCAVHGKCKQCIHFSDENAKFY